MNTSKFVRWSGIALLLAGVIFLSNLFHPNQADPNFLLEPAWAIVHISISFAFVLSLFGLIGLYLRLGERAGVLGTLGLILAFFGMALVAGPILFVDGLILPALARSEVAEAALSETGPVFSQEPYLFLTFWVFALGSILLGISIFRSGRFPRLAGILLAIAAPIWIFFAEEPPFIAYLIGGLLVSAAWIWLGYSLWISERSTEA